MPGVPPSRQAPAVAEKAKKKGSQKPKKADATKSTRKSGDSTASKDAKHKHRHRHSGSAKHSKEKKRERSRSRDRHHHTRPRSKSTHNDPPKQSSKKKEPAQKPAKKVESQTKPKPVPQAKPTLAPVSKGVSQCSKPPHPPKSPEWPPSTTTAPQDKVTEPKECEEAKELPTALMAAVRPNNAKTEGGGPLKQVGEPPRQSFMSSESEMEMSSGLEEVITRVSNIIDPDPGMAMYPDTKEGKEPLNHKPTQPKPVATGASRKPSAMLPAPKKQLGDPPPHPADVQQEENPQLVQTTLKFAADRLPPAQLSKQAISYRKKADKQKLQLAKVKRWTSQSDAFKQFVLRDLQADFGDLIANKSDLNLTFEEANSQSPPNAVKKMPILRLIAKENPLPGPGGFYLAFDLVINERDDPFLTVLDRHLTLTHTETGQVMTATALAFSEIFGVQQMVMRVDSTTLSYKEQNGPFSVACESVKTYLGEYGYTADFQNVLRRNMDKCAARLRSNHPEPILERIAVAPQILITTGVDPVPVEVGATVEVDLVSDPEEEEPRAVLSADEASSRTGGTSASSSSSSSSGSEESEGEGGGPSKPKKCKTRSSSSSAGSGRDE